MRNLLSKAAKYRAEARRRKLWQRVVSLLVCVVVFITTYAQILPAIALEADLFEPDGHVHTDECYKIVKTEEKTELDCPLELHTHTAACYDADGALSCGYADFVVHTHDSFCCDENGKLVCTLPEIEEHTHTALCYPVQVDDPAAGTGSTGAAHVHTDECYTETPGALVCGEEETDGHTHTEDCYVETERLVCELEESEGHTHTDLCMDAEGLPELCGLEESEGHTHDESCYETVRELVCELEEAEPHTHTEDCYAPAEKELTCGFEESGEEEAEGSTEQAALFAQPDEDPQPICGQEEIELHTHTAACFGAGGAVVCGQIEVLEHQHTEDCLRVVQEASEEKVLDCAYTGSEDKADDEKPADSSTGKDEEPADSSAGEDKDGEKPADSDSTGEKPANSGSEKPADSGSTGGDKDGSEETDKDGKTPTDGTTAPSDPDDEPVLTPATLAERVLAAAESHIGYKEDAEDCDIDADGETRGLTQFGLHYGMPYEKWDAMFVAYCLEEAGAEELPSAADCLFDIDVWASMLDGAGYCQTAELYTPEPGDVAFFDLDGDGTLDHVAFVEKVTDTRLFVIAGDSNDCVRRASYARADESVVGYGVLPRDEDEGAADGGLTGEPSEDETEDDPAASDPVDEPQDGEDSKTDEKDPDKPDEDGKTEADDPDKAGEDDKTGGKDDDKKNEDADQDSTQEAALGLAGRVLAAAQAEFGYTSAPDSTTLYRAFYDDPTAPLDVLFVAYCLDQAGIEGVPSAQDSGFDSEQWRAALAEAGMFCAVGAEEAAPAPGEVLFLDKDGDGAADFVAIVEKVAGGKVHVLEMAEAPAVAVAALALDTDEENADETTASAAASCVRRVAYSLTDTQVLGYTVLASLEDEDTALTEEEQAQVDAVIALIDALPDQETLAQKMAELDEAGDEDAADAYLTKLRMAAIAAYKAYEKLSEEQQQKVTNAEKLLALEWLWSAETLPDEDGLTDEQKELLAQERVYPGKQQTDGTWVVYDAVSEQEASIRATVTLPEGASAPQGAYLFIRKVVQGEGYYPTESAVQKTVGAFNDFQCYAIHWVRIDEDGKPDYNVESVLTEGAEATVKIEYLKTEAALGGHAAERKLMIFNSRQDGNELEEISATVTEVGAENEYYTGFTFRTSRAGPYVFVSKKVSMGYVEGISIAITDGSEPFDLSDTDGNDSGPNNKIVRSYDTIQYDLTVTFAARENGVQATSADMYFEMSLYKGLTAAEFDTSKMLWIGDNYTIEYLDTDGNVVMTRAHDGTYWDANGSEVALNSIVEGSTEGIDSYTLKDGNIVEQRLTGWTTLKATEENPNILAATKSFSAAIQVKNADNGDVFAPSFKLWLDGNEDNYGSESGTNGETKPAEKVTANQVTAENVTVSAGVNFNIQLKKNGDLTYKSWFDFSTGTEVPADKREELDELAILEANWGKSNPADFVDKDGGVLSVDKQREYANYRYGRMIGYGITLQLYNDTDNEPANNRASKGMKGLSLPVGDITFDLNLTSSAKSGNVEFDTENYTPILWECNENISATSSYNRTYDDHTVVTSGDGRGNWGRNLYWNNEARSPYAKGGAPSNYKFFNNGCYYGGDWFVTSEKTFPQTVKGTGADTVYTFKVSDYDFDFDNRHFPNLDAGNSGIVTAYDTYAKCFSAGYIQVLNVFPRYQSQSVVDLRVTVTVNNLALQTRRGQELKADENDETKRNHEVNTSDNTRVDQIDLYAIGGISKGNSFNKKGVGGISSGYLGTDYWTTSYDCNAYAGDTISLRGYGMLNASTDYRIKAMNLLQLFDSRALHICDTPTEYLDTTSGSAAYRAKILYAADPDYPLGYDTNQNDVLEYMNKVREEDLLYFTTLEALEASHYTCVGVLMEVRGCDLMGGKYQHLVIPVQVTGDDPDLVSKTVATVNAVRIWTDEEDMKAADGSDITWQNGEWDYVKGKNTLEGYSVPNGLDSATGHYSAEHANGKTVKTTYVKTEYEDGGLKSDTHVGGVQYGNSLLILSYTAGIHIRVTNKGASDSGSITYDLDTGENIVSYALCNIETKEKPFGSEVQADTKLTELTVKAVLDEGHTGDTRITVAAGTYKMNGISISSDSTHPTEISFDYEGKTYNILVYAHRDTDGRAVTFELSDVPVGVTLPDITFDAQFAPNEVLKNNDTLTAKAYISGTGDCRAYSDTNGNTSNVTVGVVQGGGTNLSKKVDEDYIELNGLITYTVGYTNSGNTKLDVIYLNDLLPNKQDNRGSNFDGTMVLRSFTANVTGTPASDFKVTLYYSTTGYEELRQAVDGFSNGDKDEVEKMLENGENNEGKKLFTVLGTIEGEKQFESQLAELSAADKEELLKSITGLYMKVQNLASRQTVTLEMKLETNGNKAGDLYKNVAYSWIGDQSLPLKSNQVETSVLARGISGVVWHDGNLNGVRDEDEPLISDVTCTLFKLDEDKKSDTYGKYVACTTDVTGGTISTVTTGNDGTYSFNKLAAGQYIVAFSGDALKNYNGATTYQVTGGDSGTNNDAVALIETDKIGMDTQVEISGIDKETYSYAIAYNLTTNTTSQTASANAVPLHTIEDIVGENIPLTNSVELYANLDCGLVLASYELPETGGMGTTLYTIGGLLPLGAGLLLLYKRRKRRKEVSASS